MEIARITLDPAVMGGKPCIRGLRVTVGTLLGLLAIGQSRPRILQAYPYLEPEDLDAALAYDFSAIEDALDVQIIEKARAEDDGRPGISLDEMKRCLRLKSKSPKRRG